MNIESITVGGTPGPPVAGLLAAECGRLRKLLERLPESDAPPSEELPEIRRLVRLLRSGFSMSGMRKSAARELQAVARVLADPREAVRRIGVWRKLAWNGDAVVAAAVSSMLDHQAGPAKDAQGSSRHRIGGVFRGFPPFLTQPSFMGARCKGGRTSVDFVPEVLVLVGRHLAANDRPSPQRTGQHENHLWVEPGAPGMGGGADERAAGADHCAGGTWGVGGLPPVAGVS